jgi:hypothetical protein
MITIDPIKKAAADQAKANAEARAYLSSTDWYVTRKAETGQAIPPAVIAERAEARARIT